MVTTPLGAGSFDLVVAEDLLWSPNSPQVYELMLRLYSEMASRWMTCTRTRACATSGWRDAEFS